MGSAGVGLAYAAGDDLRRRPLAVRSNTKGARNLPAFHGRTAVKIAIIGVGAIGGYVGTELALAGEDVTFIARGANLDALRSRGIRLMTADGEETGSASPGHR